MKKLVLVACAIAGFVGSSFAGQTVQWNPITNRWEYRDDGQLTGSSQWNGTTGSYEQRDASGQKVSSWRWNSVTNRWEYTEGY
jgi:hypothetical protein